MSQKYLSVTQLTQYIKKKFDYDPYLENVYLRGEISNYNSRRQYAHQYFSLKDESSLIAAVMFAGVSKKITFDLEEGMSVLARGRVSVYPKNGAYQFYVDDLQPDGIGSLYLAYEQTKKKLLQEGLFETSRKQPVPSYPQTIGVVTSPTGSVIQDIITTVRRRYPLAKLVIYPALVQGEKAAASLVTALKQAEANPALDVVIVARGGGSFEDLFPFNEEKVVRQVAALTHPLISSVGHETDTTLTDLAADLRAPTPTAAAELTVPNIVDEISRLDQWQLRLQQAARHRVAVLNEQLSRLEKTSIFMHPQRLYDVYSQDVDRQTDRLIRHLERRLDRTQRRLILPTERLKHSPLRSEIDRHMRQVEQLVTQLAQAMRHQLTAKQEVVRHRTRGLEWLSPSKILDRGYVIVEQSGERVTRASDFNRNLSTTLQFSDDRIELTEEREEE